MVKKSELVKRVRLRLSEVNKDSLGVQSEKNKRNISQELDVILDDYFNN